MTETATITEATGAKSLIQTAPEGIEIWEFRGDSLYKSTQAWPMHYVVVKQSGEMFLRFDGGEVEVGFLDFKVVSLTKDKLVLTTEGQPNLNNAMGLPYYYSYTFKNVSNDTTPLGDKSLIAGTWNVTGGTRRYNPGDGYTTEKMSTARVRDFICTCWLFDYEEGTAQQLHSNPLICDFNLAAFTLDDCDEGYKLVIEKMFVENPDMGMDEFFNRMENDDLYINHISSLPN